MKKKLNKKLKLKKLTIADLNKKNLESIKGGYISGTWCASVTIPNCGKTLGDDCPITAIISICFPLWCASPR